MDEMKMSCSNSSNRSDQLQKKVFNKKLVNAFFLGGLIVVVLVGLFKFHSLNQRLSDIDQYLSEDEEKYDTVISGFKGDIDYLKKQNSVDKDAIENLHGYILAFQANLTRLRAEHEKSLKRGSETDSHLMSLIEYHGHQSKLLNETLNQVGALHKEKSDDIKRQLNAVFESYRNLSSQLERNGEGDREHYDSIQHQQQELKRHVDNLTKRISRPVHFFDQCQLEESTCSIGSGGNGHYWKSCSTKFMPINKVGYITIENRCSSQSSATQYSENLNLFENNGEVRCDCDVTFPGENSAEHRKVGSLAGATCTLHIFRCPTTVTLFPS